MADNDVNKYNKRKDNVENEVENKDENILTKQLPKLNVQKLNVQEASHPIASMLHLSFKTIPCLCYMFMGFFGVKDVSVFIACLIIIALDFWLTKNIFGRYLVGLRWWTAGDFGVDVEEGQGLYFESWDGYYPNKTYDNHIFWWGLIAPLCFWGFYVIIGVISLSFFWGTLTLIASSQYYTNCHAFYKCRLDHQKKIEKITKQIEEERLKQKDNHENILNEI